MEACTTVGSGATGSQCKMAMSVPWRLQCSLWTYDIQDKLNKVIRSEREESLQESPQFRISFSAYAVDAMNKRAKEAAVRGTMGLELDNPGGKRRVRYLGSTEERSRTVQRLYNGFMVLSADNGHE